MKSIRPQLAALCWALFATVLLLPAHASTSAPDLDAYVVAEATAAGARLVQPSPGAPIAYVAYDGGYIEAGDPIAGDPEPAAATVAQAFRTALDAHGFHPASPAHPPSIALFYFYGAIRHDSYERSHQMRMSRNLRARLSLVTTSRTVEHIDSLSDGRHFRMLPPSFRDLLQLADGRHYFFIVSAYDYGDLTRGIAAPLWTTRLSAFDNQGGMADIVPTLARSCGPYLARDLPDVTRVDLQASVASSTVSNAPSLLAAPAEYSREIGGGFLQQLARWEYAIHAGINDPQDQPLPGHPPPPSPSATFPARVVAARTPANALRPVPSPAQPTYYAAYENVDVVPFGEKMPPPGAVARVLAGSLRSRGYLPAAANTPPPSIVLACRWGTRLETSSSVGDGDMAVGTGTSSTFDFLDVAAYDLADLKLGTRTLLWSATITADQYSTLRDDVPALAIAIGDFLDRDTQTGGQKVSVRVGPVAGNEASGESDPFTLSRSFAPLDAGIIRAVMADARDRHLPRKASDLAGPVGVPPALARRITAYLDRKFALQKALSARIEALPAEADPHDAIDTFVATNADRIAALTQERDAIRTELTHIDTSRLGKISREPIEAIRRAFESDVLQMQRPQK